MNVNEQMIFPVLFVFFRDFYNKLPLNIIKATEKFKSVVIMATAGIAVFYLLAIVLMVAAYKLLFTHA